jgi:hypothetical protein
MLDGLGMKDILLSSMAEFLPQSNHRRPIGIGCLTLVKILILAIFPSLAFLMKIDHDFVQQMLLETGLARKTNKAVLHSKCRSQCLGQIHCQPSSKY